MFLIQLCFTADAKFLTSFLTITISIVTWCRRYIFFFRLILAQHCLFVSSSKRELKQRRSTFKFLLLIVLIERFARKFGHHTARQNTAQAGGCKTRTFRWRKSGSKRLLSSLIKMLNNINMQNVVSPHAGIFLSKKRPNRRRRSTVSG